MSQRIEATLEPGKLVKDPPEAVYHTLMTEAQADEVIVALLETASDEQLRGGAARVWVALTDRRALVLAAVEPGDSFVKSVDSSSVSHRGRLGRDEITVGEGTYKCPLLRGGTHFKQFASLAAAHPIERLRTAARQRLEEEQPRAAAALTRTGLESEKDVELLTLRVLALIAADQMGDLGEALVDYAKHDNELTRWNEIAETIGENSRLLWMAYQAAAEAGSAPALRARLPQIRKNSPPDRATAELAITMDVDEGAPENGLDRAIHWHRAGSIDAEAFLATCDILARAGLDSERLHRLRAVALSDTGNLEDALKASSLALSKSETKAALRVHADLLVRSKREEDAVAPLEQLLTLGVDDYWIQSRLGKGYEASKSYDKAVVARELALARLFEGPADPEQAASERRALARLHRSIASNVDSAQREVRLACADLLERGLDWAARIVEEPGMICAGAELAATVEILAARPLSEGPTTASFSFVEEVLDPKADSELVPEAPALLQGGIAGVWPPPEVEDDVVQTGKKTARVRYAVGEKTWADLGDGQARGLHLAKVSVPIPADVRPNYAGDRVYAQLELELSPPGARFPVQVAPCHMPKETKEFGTEREGKGKHQLRAIIDDTAWSFGKSGEVRLEGHLSTDRLPSKIQASLVATERLRPPYKGERVVETLSWTFPVFDYEAESGKIDRCLRLDLPIQGRAAGIWTWFELVWELEINLLRKEKSDASVHLPIHLRYPPIDDNERATLLSPMRGETLDSSSSVQDDPTSTGEHPKTSSNSADE